MTDKALETAWVQICGDAGWTDALYCTADLRARKAYEAKIDALAAEREPMLRELISKARGGRNGPRDRYVSAYVDGIESALNRAIETPRVAS